MLKFIKKNKNKNKNLRQVKTTYKHLEESFVPPLAVFQLLGKKTLKGTI